MVGNYYKATRNKNCPEDRIIRSLEECKSASSELKTSFQELTHLQKGNPKRYPAGCFWKGVNSDKSSFNPIIDTTKTLSLTQNIAVGGICKSAGKFVNGVYFAIL